MQNLATIWGALACGFALDPEAFGKLCSETHAIYMEHLSWFPITPTLHKVLCHGKDLVEHCPLPIGLTNEEPGECANGKMRLFRSGHSRRTSWKDGLADLFYRLMDNSDPLIRTIATKHKKPKASPKPISDQIKKLLLAPILAIAGEDSDIETDF